jgi:tetratricopeptide (TPR) repeat protein
VDENVRQLLTIGRGHFAKLQYAQAERYLGQVLEHTQAFADVHNMLGVIYHDQGRFERAQESFRAALRLNPAYTEAALNLAVACNDLGKYDEARAVYQAALSRQKREPGGIDPFVKGKIANMYAEIGDAFASSGLWPQAIVEYRRALELGPDFMDIRLKLADAHRDSGDLPRAIAELEQLVRDHPDYQPGQIHYGLCLYSSGRKVDATKVWEAVIARDPDNPSAQMYLHLVNDAGKDAQASPMKTQSPPVEVEEP